MRRLFLHPLFSNTYPHDRTIPECQSFLPWPRCHGSSSLFGEVISFCAVCILNLHPIRNNSSTKHPQPRYKGFKALRTRQFWGSDSRAFINKSNLLNRLLLWLRVGELAATKQMPWRCLFNGGVMVPDAPGMFPEDKEPSNHLKYEVLIVGQWPN